MAYLKRSNIKTKVDSMKHDLKGFSTEMILDDEDLLDEIIAFRFENFVKHVGINIKP